LTIHYHGTPLTPRSELLRMAGECFCVPFSDPRDADVCLSIGQSVMWDNGAFSAFTAGRIPSWVDYYAWLDSRLGHPHWAVVPDVIDGPGDVQDELVSQWPFDPSVSAPVWHTALPIDRLIALADKWPRICFGSSGEFWDVGSERWSARIDAAFDALSQRHRTLPHIHMLRGAAQAGGRWPFASVDSANVARNYKTARRDPVAMAREIDAVQCPIRWVAPLDRTQHRMAI